LYSEKTEAFVTFRPAFTVGESVRIGAHLSKLGGDRFLPYADARVTVTLAVAGSTVTTSVEKPNRPGVFRLALTPTKAGTGMGIVEASAVFADPAARFGLETRGRDLCSGGRAGMCCVPHRRDSFP
jgi:hypothetical protein